MGTKSNMMVLDAKLLIRGNGFVVLYGVAAMCQKSLDLIGRLLHSIQTGLCCVSKSQNPLIFIGQVLSNTDGKTNFALIKQFYFHYF